MSPSPGPQPTAAGEADRCCVPGCEETALRHLSLAEARRAFRELPEQGRSAPLCRAHYKEWKKRTKESRTLDRLAW
ncbi:MAG: hypothetical protein L3J95_01105 [Thermoplasmata archaeon]|nr:hypothetical protein [Thermoplasmata archaeon]MCI4359015.1 hypothetical protein [Thermoplasmata archaeon]